LCPAKLTFRERLTGRRAEKCHGTLRLVREFWHRLGGACLAIAGGTWVIMGLATAAMSISYLGGRRSRSLPLVEVTTLTVVMLGLIIGGFLAFRVGWKTQSKR
jgi:hypothetical protein